MSLPCIPCAEPQVCIEGLDRYSLQDDVFFFLFRCPPGQICGRNNVLFILCCDGNLIRVDFPIGMSADNRNQLITNAVTECERKRSFCEPVPPDDCVTPPCPPIEYFYSAPATCTIRCPDGTPFVYTVPAGLFLARTFAEAQAQAQAYACEQAPLHIFCLPDLVKCACMGTPYAAVLAVSPSKNVKFILASGTLPPGLSFPMGVFISNGVLRIGGTPTATGSYPFIIRAMDENGNYVEKLYTIAISGITTTSLPNFTIGSPYSFQLAAFGTGTLTFGIQSGSLPDGLSVSTSGLISGTPTALAAPSTIVFALVDSACEEANPKIFVPRAVLVTSSTTRIETRHGFPEFIGGGTGLLYKRADFSGQIIQKAFPNFNADETINETQCGGAKYEYAGFDQIDNYGIILNRHTKNVSLMCDLTAPGLWIVQPDPGTDNTYSLIRLNGIGTLRGYCWDDDPNSCGGCNPDDSTWTFEYNAANFGTVDLPNGILFDSDNFSATTLVQTYDGDAGLGGGICLTPPALPGGVTNFPLNNGVGTINQGLPYVRLESTGLWTITLSDPFTDADAASSAVVFSSTSSVAQNANSTFVTNNITHRKNTRTTVAYAINMTNLVAGTNYIAQVQLVSSTGARSVVSISFTAVGSTHTISGVVPTPAANTTIRVQNPRVVFA